MVVYFYMYSMLIYHVVVYFKWYFYVLIYRVHGKYTTMMFLCIFIMSCTCNHCGSIYICLIKSQNWAIWQSFCHVTLGQRVMYNSLRLTCDPLWRPAELLSALKQRRPHSKTTRLAPAALPWRPARSSLLLLDCLHHLWPLWPLTAPVFSHQLVAQMRLRCCYSRVECNDD